MSEIPEDETDPRIEQALRLGELRKEIMDRVEGPSIESGTANLSMDMQERFLENVLAFECAEEATFFERLREEVGFTPQPLEDLDGSEATKRALWDLLRALASIRVFVFGTDHLSDADLYRLLMAEALPDLTMVPPKGEGWNCRIDACEFGTADDPEGTNIWLRYYADDLTRDEWDGPLPAKEEPPYDRDRFLPLPPEETRNNE